MYSQVSIVNLDMEQLKSLYVALNEMDSVFLGNFGKINFIDGKLEFISYKLSIRTLQSQIISLPKKFKLDRLAYSLSPEEEVRYDLTVDREAGLKVAYGVYGDIECVFVFSNLHGEDIHVVEYK